MKKYFTLLLLFISLASKAQNLTLFKASYSNYPATEITEGMNGEEASFSEFDISVNIPAKFNEGKTILINGLKYTLVQPEFSGPNTSVEGDLHFISYSATLVKRLKNNWLFVGTFSPAISSDLEGSLSSDDILLLGRATVGRAVSETFRWNAGLAFTSRFGEPLVIPVIELYHKKNNFKLHVNLPVKVEGTFIKEKFQYGLRIGLGGSQFNLETTATQPVDDIRFSRVNLGPVVNYGLTEHVFLSLFAGFSTGRRYDATSDTIGDFDFSSEDGPFVSFGVYVK